MTETGGLYPNYDSFAEEVRPLLKQVDDQGAHPSAASPDIVAGLVERIRSAVHRAVRTGAILDGFEERRDFQKELDYLAKLLERLGAEPEDPLLEPFQPEALAAMAMPAYPFDDLHELQERSPAPGREQLQEYLLARARQAGIRYEDGLVADLAGQLTGDPEAWQLLDFCLWRFYTQAQRGGGNKLRRPSGVTSFDARLFAVAAAEQAYGDYPDERKAEFRQALVRLSLDPRSGPLQGNLRERPGLALGDRYPAVLAHLLERRLVWQTDPTAARYVLVHRCILDRWSDLGDWVERERDKRRTRRNWLSLFGLVVASMAGLYVWWVTETAAQAQANEVAIGSLEWLPVNNDFALAMALEAVCMKPTDLGWESLARALDGRRELHRFRPRGGERTLAIGYLGNEPVALAAGTQDGATVWEMVGQDKKAYPLRGLRPNLRLAAFSSEGKRVAVVREADTGEWTLGVWLVETGELLDRELPLDGPVSALAISRDGAWVASGNAHGQVAVFSVLGSPVGQLSLTHGRPVSGLAFTADGRRLMAGGNYEGMDERTGKTKDAEGKVSIWDVASGGQVAHVQGEREQAFLAVGAEVGGDVLSLWVKLDDSLRVEVVRGDRRTRLTDVSPPAQAAFDPFGRQLLLVGWDGSVQIVDLERGEVRLTLSPTGTASGGSGVFSPDGEQVSVSYSDASARVFRVATEPLRIDPHPSLRGDYRNWVFTGAAFSPAKGKKEVTAGTGDGRIYVFDGDTRQVRHRLPAEPGQQKDLILEGNVVRDMAYSRDGRLLVAAYRLGGARVWDVDKGTLVASADLPRRECEPKETEACIESNALRCASFAPDPEGSRYVTTRSDGAVAVWKTGGGAPVVKQPASQAATPFCVWFEEDGQRLIGISIDGALLTGSSDSGEPLVPLRPESLRSDLKGLGLERGGGVELDGPGGKLAVRPAPERGNYVSVIDLRAGEASGWLPLPDPRRLTNFALRGRRLGLLEADGVSVWDTGGETGASWKSWLGRKRDAASGGLRKLTKHGKSGSVARLSPDGSWLFVAGNTGDISYCRACGSTADPVERAGWRGEAAAVWADLAQDRAFAELFRCMKGKSKDGRTGR